MKRLPILVILIALFALTGCAGGLRVKILVPPRDDVTSVERVLVVPVAENFTGASRSIVRDVGDALHLMLRDSAFYSESKLHFHEGAETDGNPEGEALKKLAAENGAQAVIIVNLVNYDASVLAPSPVRFGFGMARHSRWSSTYMGFDTDDDYYRSRGELSAMFTMVRASDLNVLSRRKIVVHYSDVSYLPEGRRDILQNLARAAASRYMPFIDVSEAFTERYFLVSRAHRASDDAAEIAYDGNWEQARKIWEAVNSRDPRDPAPIYNLGIYFETRGKYPEALEYYLAARAATGDEKAFPRTIREARNSVTALEMLHKRRDVEKPAQEKEEDPASKKAAEEKELEDSGRAEPAPMEKDEAEPGE